MTTEPPDWLKNDRLLFGGLLGFSCVCVVQVLGAQSLSRWAHAQLFCHAVAIPLLAFRLVHLLRPPTKASTRGRLDRGVELIASSLAVVGFGLLIAHLNEYAGLAFALTTLLSVVLAWRS